MVIEERNRLLESIQPYLLMLACKYSSKNYSPNELLGAANMRLLKYIPTWDAAISSLPTFARHHATGAFWDHMREQRTLLSKTRLAVRENREPEVWSIENTRRDGKRGDETDILLAESLADKSPSPLESLVRQECVERLRKALAASGLTKRERQAVTVMLNEGCTQAEAAARIGVNYSRVSQLRKSAIAKMRRRMKAAA